MSMDAEQADQARPPDTVRFNALWEAHSRRVLAYALRRTDAETAQEVMAETFLVAWRRLADVPGDPLPWLLIVARNTMSNLHRSRYRQDLLHDELERLQQLAGPEPGVDQAVVGRAEVLSALAALTPNEREALLLVAWDGLSPRDAAQVAGCSASAFHVRLHRARRRLQSRATPHRHPDPGPAARPLPEGTCA